MTALTTTSEIQTPSSPAGRARFWTLTIGSVGVVYGDIGTSPLYALRESLNAARAGDPFTPDMVYGVLSLMIWALFIIVTLKYVLVILRADNAGEGGTLSLLALAQRAVGTSGWLIPLLGIAGASLFYGDAMITPAISVLSAVEGIGLLTPAFNAYVLPISLVILIGLFAVQARGTARVARWFGPIILVWLLALTLGGLTTILQNPSILFALNPLYGLSFLSQHGFAGLVALGAVFLTVTGAEALYADLGHFGAKPIRFAWLTLVFPALVINYLGQGVLVLADPATLENPFFRLYPSWALLPMVVLATLATIIASQAVITGAYSMTQQAVQLNLLPRFDVRRTSETEKGQIYIPAVNWILLLAVLYLVVSFGNSGALASAYGIAVTGTMVVTVMLAFVVIWRGWGWPLWATIALLVPFLLIDLVFLGANMLKIAEGGWMPLAVAALLMTLMTTWRTGSRLLADKTRAEDLPLTEFLDLLERRAPERVAGTAVFLTSHPEMVPSALMHNLKHNHVLHKRNIIVSIATADTPRAEASPRAAVSTISKSFQVVQLTFGYMEEPDVPKALAAIRQSGSAFDPQSASYYLSRKALRPSARSRMPVWQDRLFVMMARTASDASRYFNIPTGRVIEVGTQIVI